MRKRQPCTIDGCPDAVIARGWCNRHYYRFRRYGSPTAELTYGRDDISYSGAHARVKSTRGRPSTHACTCGAVAQDWAYDNNDPAEMVDERGYAYSIKPSHYLPMCRLCHKRHDMAHRRAAAEAYRQIRFGGATPCASCK